MVSPAGFPGGLRGERSPIVSTGVGKLMIPLVGESNDVLAGKAMNFLMHILWYDTAVDEFVS